MSKNVCPRWLGVANTITNTLAEHAPYYATLRLVLCSQKFSRRSRAFTEFGCFVGYGEVLLHILFVAIVRDLYQNNILVKVCLYIVC